MIFIQVKQINADNRSEQSRVNSDNSPQAGTLGQPQEKKEDNQTEKEKKSETQLFCERVAIAGLEESYKAEFLPDKAMFRIALLFAFSFIIYEAQTVVLQSKKNRIVSIDLPILDQQAPFPNVSICFPVSINEDIFRQKMVITPKTASLMQRHNITVQHLIDYMKDAISLNLKGGAMGTVLNQVASKLYDSSMAEAQHDKESYIGVLNSLCPNVLSNCFYGGRAFDCCEAAEFTTIWTSSCYVIRVNHIRTSQKANRSTSNVDTIEKVQSDASELTFDISTDWTFGVYDDGSASDGFHVFINRLPTAYEDPVNIPSSMDARVILAPPRKVSEIQACSKVAPKVKYFDYYDPYGTRCIAVSAAELISKNLGCMMPIMSYLPPDSCSLNQVFLLTLAFTDAGINDLQNALLGEERMNEMKEEWHKSTKLLFSQATPCKPLCTRWTYGVLSASYNSIQYRDSNMQKGQSNRSWSRIKVIMPLTAPWSHTEKLATSTYLVLCKIGGVMAVYAGFSVITLAHVVFYGACVVCSKRKKKDNRVRPLVIDRKKSYQPPVETNLH